MIRKATLEDLEKIIVIIRRVKQLMAEGGNPQWDSEYPGEKEYREDIKNGELYVEERDGTITGFMTVNAVFPKEYEDVRWSTSLPACTIHRLAVNPECRGSGTARRLFEYAENISRQQGVYSIRLDTFSLNTAAQKLFERNGYKYAGYIYMKGRTIPYRCYEKSLDES